jgi:hypothetical protein
LFSVLGRRPRAGSWTWYGGAGVEERSVKETAGKRADYGDLDTAVGWLLKARLRSQDMGALVKLGAEGPFTEPLTDGTLRTVSV